MKMKKLIKAVALAVCLTMTAPVVATSVGIETVEAAESYTKEEKQLAKKLAVVKDMMKDPDSFKILKIYKGSYVYDQSEDQDNSLYKMVHMNSKKYKYKVVYSAKNSYGGTVTDKLYLTSKYKYWMPEKDYHDALLVEKSAKNMGSNAIKRITKLVNKYYDEI